MFHAYLVFFYVATNNKFLELRAEQEMIGGSKRMCLHSHHIEIFVLPYQLQKKVTPTYNLNKLDPSTCQYNHTLQMAKTCLLSMSKESLIHAFALLGRFDGCW